MARRYEDHNGFTWLVEDVNVDLEEIELAPTLGEAIEILTQFIADHVGNVDSGEEITRAAIAAHVVLQDHGKLERRVQALETEVSGLGESVRRLTAMVEELQRPTQSA